MKTLLLKKVLIGIVALTGVVGGVAILISSQSSKPIHLGIMKPTTMDVPFSSNEFNAEDGFLYEGEFGTEVTVPADAFVNKKGEVVTGQVELKVREFHGLKDVFLSGITMQSKEGDEVMKSGGMIELKAFQGEDTLELVQGKTLDIKLSFTGDPDENYDLFYLENDNAWGEPMQFETLKNDGEQGNLVEIEKLDLDSDSVFEIHTAYKGRPFLKMWKDVKWQLFNCDGELPYTEVNDVIWDYIHVKPLDEQRNLFSIDMVSTMHTYNGVTKQYQSDLVARPILSDKDLASIKRKGEEIESKLSRQVSMLFEKEKRDAERVEKEMKDWRLAKEDLSKTLEERKIEAIAEYEAQLKREQDEYQKQASRAALFSKFKANQFGIWNIDCLLGLEFQEVLCQVEIEGEIIERETAMSFLLMEEMGSVVRLNRGSRTKFPRLEEDCSLVVIYEDGWVGWITADEYKEKLNEAANSSELIEFKGNRMTNEELDEKLGEIGRKKIEKNEANWRAKFS
jgi:hypothetical protein